VTIRRLLILVVLVGAAAVAIGPAPASAAPKPCWKRLINDWFDGRIDNVYPVKCYREAIKHLPEDVESYSDARAEIQRALLSAIRASGGSLGPDDPVPAQPQGGSQGSGGNDPGETTTEPGAAGGNGDDGGSGEAAPPPGGEGGGDGLIDAVKPANADSVPIPLLVLAGLALVLLAAAAAGFAARRIQARRLRVSPAPPDPNAR
jgi:hypothetical protein